jgi:LAO/AO transport system kinase
MSVRAPAKARTAGTPPPAAPVGAVARRILQHDRRTLAKLISDVESGKPEAREVLRELYPFTGKVPIVGFSGPLGVGKSSLINELLGLLRSQGKRVGVIAVDPTSPFSGGAVLGDRIRIERDHRDDGVFFRSMASRGHAGGLSQSARDAVRLMEAFGMDVVLVETVGSGQVDVEVHDLATTRIVVVVPHLGDEVQSLKAGLFEIADLFVVNKADLPGADRAARYLEELSSLGKPRAGWTVRVVQSSVYEKKGIDELWKAVEEHERALQAGPEGALARRRRIERELRGLLLDRVRTRLEEELRADPSLREPVEDVIAGRTDPYTASDRVFELLRKRL